MPARRARGEACGPAAFFLLALRVGILAPAALAVRVSGKGRTGLPAMETRRLFRMQLPRRGAGDAILGARPPPRFGAARADLPLVVLDVMMPTLSGWELCKYIRTKAELADTRVVMLTAIGKTVNEMTSPLYGADAYLDKPFDIQEIVQVVSDLLAKPREA